MTTKTKLPRSNLPHPLPFHQRRCPPPPPPPPLSLSCVRRRGGEGGVPPTMWVGHFWENYPVNPVTWTSCSTRSLASCRATWRWPKAQKRRKKKQLVKSQDKNAHPHHLRMEGSSSCNTPPKKTTNKPHKKQKGSFPSHVFPPITYVRSGWCHCFDLHNIGRVYPSHTIPVERES